MICVRRPHYGEDGWLLLRPDSATFEAVCASIREGTPEDLVELLDNREAHRERIMVTYGVGPYVKVLERRMWPGDPSYLETLWRN